jgi:hypothetical protein
MEHFDDCRVRMRNQCPSASWQYTRNVHSHDDNFVIFFVFTGSASIKYSFHTSVLLITKTFSRRVKRSAFCDCFVFPQLFLRSTNNCSHLQRHTTYSSCATSLQYFYIFLSLSPFFLPHFKARGLPTTMICCLSTELHVAFTQQTSDPQASGDDRNKWTSTRGQEDRETAWWVQSPLPRNQ